MAQLAPSDRLIRGIIALAFAVGVGVFVVAVLIGGGDDNDITVSNNDAIEELVPARGDEVLAQTEVALDLAAGYRGQFLTHNGRDVAEFTTFNAALNRVVLDLPDGLDPDQNCVEAGYWNVARPDEVSVIGWCFTAA